MPSSTGTPDFRIRRADWQRDGDALRLVRGCVFVEEQGVPPGLEWDDADAIAIHLLALDADGRPIGTARLLPTGQIGRMAVLPRQRRRGVGSALLRALLAIARADGHPSPFLHAQTAAVPFYLRLGFQPVGDEYTEAGIPHRNMIPSDRA